VTGKISPAGFNPLGRPEMGETDEDAPSRNSRLPGEGKQPETGLFHAQISVFVKKALANYDIFLYFTGLGRVGCGVGSLF
jgi:hypothetical protein